jgi:hypothetical protein
VKQTSLSCAVLVALSTALLGGESAVADELGQKGKVIFKTHQHAVVTVQLVLKSKISMGGVGGQANESRQDITGTVIDASGLTVVSLAATDPAQMLQSLMSGMSDEESRFKFETELSDIKILLEDGSELSAEVVLRDRDLDLAFIRPKAKPAAPAAFLDLAKSEKADILDQVLALNRLGSAGNRAYSASVERIAAIVQRPRLFYIPDTSLNTALLGAPAFTFEGKVVGIFVMRVGKTKGGASAMFAMQPDNVISIIVPADDVLKAAKQVPAAAEKKE